MFIRSEAYLEKYVKSVFRGININNQVMHFIAGSKEPDKVNSDAGEAGYELHWASSQWSG